MSLDGTTPEIPSLSRYSDTGVQYQTQQYWKFGEKRPSNQPSYGQQKITRTVRIGLPKESEHNFFLYSDLAQRIVEKVQGDEDRLKKTTFYDQNSGTEWVVVKKSNLFKFIGKVLNRLGLFKMIHIVESPAFVDYELKQKSLTDQFKWWLFNLSASTHELYKNIVVDIPPADPTERYAQNGFEDPLTKIAGQAYQTVEHDFVGHDEGQTPGTIDSDYIIILDLKEGSDTERCLRLIPKADKHKYKEQAQNALTMCRLHYMKEYGREKTEYIQHLSGFNFEHMDHSFHTDDFQGVTPEHIYRMNVGMTSCESQDIEGLTTKLVYLQTHLKSIPDNTPLIGVLSDLQKESYIWSDKDVRGVLNFISRKTRKPIEDLAKSDFNQAFPHLPQENLSTKLQMTKIAILNTSKAYLTLKEYLTTTHDLKGIWNEDEIEAIWNLVQAHKGVENPTPDDFIETMQFLSYAKKKIAGFTPRELAGKTLVGLLQEIDGRSPPVDYHFIETLLGPTDDTIKAFLQGIDSPAKNLTSADYNDLVTILRPSDDERKRAYTGREIKKSIDSAYTIAHKNFLKPWVDQQEFAQACVELEKDTILDLTQDWKGRSHRKRKRNG